MWLSLQNKEKLKSWKKESLDLINREEKNVINAVKSGSNFRNIFLKLRAGLDVFKRNLYNLKIISNK